ncbi:MAG: TonB-dependent receptor [Rudaea sp.]|uniref:TonB-dependent receptor n=1 Tax=Rudaea sp. TaxID=2136325 RepID=UPI0039E30400
MCHPRIFTLCSVLALSCSLMPTSRAAEATPAPADPKVAASTDDPDWQASPSDATTNDAAKTTQNLESVVVTGRAGVDARTKEQTSYSITQIGEEALRLQAPTSVTESLKSVPGFWVEASGGEASGNVRARGIPVDGFGSITLLEDGVPIQHDPGLTWYNVDQVFRLDETIDGVEVVRGGPSFLFYPNAPAAAVNYIPRKVGEEASGLFKYTWGDYGYNRTDFWYGAPIGNSGWKYSVGGFFRQAEGVRDPGYTGDKGGQLRGTLFKEWDDGKFSVDLKHLNDHVDFFVPVPLHRDSSGDIVAVPGFDGNYDTVAGPETAHMTFHTSEGAYDWDGTQGTYVNRTQVTAKFEQKFGDDWKFSDSFRYSTTNTKRNGTFSNSVLSGIAELASLSTAANLALFPGAAGFQLRYTDNPNQVFDLGSLALSGSGTLNGQNGNGLVLVNQLRALWMPEYEYGNDAHVSTKFDFLGAHDFTAGVYYSHQNMDFNRVSSLVLTDVRGNARLLDVVAVDANGNALGNLTYNGILRNGSEFERDTGKQDSYAFYLGDEWQITHDFRLDFGWRWDRNEMHNTNTTRLPATSSFVYNGVTYYNQGGNYLCNLNDGLFADTQVACANPSNPFTTTDHSFSKSGWTVGANYQLTDRAGLFARYTSTYRLPNFSTFIANSLALPITQTMDLGEVGAKWGSEWATLYATWFYTKYDNVTFSSQILASDNVTLLTQTAVAQTKTTGFELEGDITPTAWFDLHFSATLEDPKYRNLRAVSYSKDSSGNLVPTISDFSGNQLIRVPKVSYRLAPRLMLLDNKLQLQLSYEYEGKRYSDTANLSVLPQYHVINASAEYDINERMSVFGYVDNLTNSVGLTEGNPRSGDVISTDAGKTVFLARPLLGRAYRLSFMYKF